MKTRYTLSLLTSLFFLSALLIPSSTDAQPPRSPDWVELPIPYTTFKDSLIRGNIVDADYLDAIPLGDIDNSGTDDFALMVRVRRVDSADESSTADFPIIVRSQMKESNLIVDTTWLHPASWQSGTDIVGVGDWDGDGFVDLCTDIRIHGDTTVGPTFGKEIHRVVIFWNDGEGGYSLNDTTRLPNPGGFPNDVWYARQSLTIDYNGDAVDDLLVEGGGGFYEGESFGTASMYLFHGGQGIRWGRSGIPATPVWSWWNLPEHNRARIVDQNCDNLPDIIFFYDRSWGSNADITIYYGTEESMGQGVPDTLDVEAVTYDAVCPGSTYSELEDYTSDGILDLVVSCEDEYWNVYVGEPGWRISEVFGSGNDTADPDNGYPNNRPWTRIPMPGRLSKSWGSPTKGPIKLLGDVNNDGWRDLWSVSRFYVIVYSAGPGFDAWIDGYVPWGGNFKNMVRLGNVDGSGETMYAVVSSYFSYGAVKFFKSSDLVPWEGTPKPVPAGHNPWTPTPNRCNSKVSVEGTDGAPDSLDLSLRIEN